MKPEELLSFTKTKTKTYSLSFIMKDTFRHDIDTVRSSLFDFMPSSLHNFLKQYETDIKTTMVGIKNLVKKLQDSRI